MKKLLLFFVLITSQLYFSQSDCVSAAPICGDTNFSAQPTGPGLILEDLGGCLSDDENYSLWYKFTIATGGSLTFSINPNVFADDYDFGVYGPNPNCSLLGPPNSGLLPIRCNFSGADGPTGLSLTATDPNGGGTQWSSALNVLPGEIYYLVVDNFSNSPNGFSISFGGTATLLTPFDNNIANQYQPNPFLQPGPNQNGEIDICENPTIFNFSTLSAGIINGNPNFVVKYYTSATDAIDNVNPITAPISVNSTTTYHYAINYVDPNPISFLNQCREFGTIKFIDRSIKLTNATLTACNNNNAGTAKYDLTAAAINPTSMPNLTLKYYPSMADLNAGTNQITNLTAYESAEKSVFVKATNTFGCTQIVEIELKFYTVIVLTPVTLESCYIPNAITTASFDLTSANVSTLPGITKKFYPTMADALAGTNEIFNQTIFITTDRDVFVRVFDTNGCYAITKITLKVLPPVKSTVLKDKTICMEDRTTLDAGPGFDGYEWSTGATTQTIQGVPVGSYWVKLQTGKCFTMQQVNVYASQQPIIASLDITNNTITVNASGGTAPYQYSIDGITWQNSNVFNNLPRGENKIYLKDSFDCNPIIVQVTVPNLINAITPNGDNVNDVLDYTSLAYKKDLVFTIYNRYGNKIYEGDKMRNYKWDGTSSGKKIGTGTYWYTISWTENDANRTQTKYSGWILVKNRE
ncbi:T9SS type B sorting domain-containing protein [Chryseobacterium aquaticum]|uniref:Chromophore lyase n=1 Tax=Chryseobacterium aquaticum subsp. greenlandense TaxID=345663 RepID=A0A117KCP5_9FLAO|nr:gliding motility-associated C-terminal domain-containing protein [Chryseobacterium aquaticum]KUJ57851.1 chromophore lyase [Chryseobacterium aquaticum subsp. greenlandense]